MTNPGRKYPLLEIKVVPNGPKYIKMTIFLGSIARRQISEKFYSPNQG